MVRPAKAELCAALDSSDRDWILATASSLAPVVGWMKIGLEAFVAHGPALVDELADGGARVFLDLKLHDIPATVRRATANAASCGAEMITVHAGGGPEMVAAAVRGAADSGADPRPLVVAVTLLTSLDTLVMADLGFALSAPEAVARWTRMATGCGVDGVVASPLEAVVARRSATRDLLVVTPGIRPAGHGADDQRRTATPAEAVAFGADLLVVGRPITRAPSPLEAARAILAEMEGEDQKSGRSS
jgi:orotidine-5'-phosphate decarboxylase